MADKVLTKEEKLVDDLVKSKIKSLAEFVKGYADSAKVIQGLISGHTEFKALKRKVAKMGGETATGGASAGDDPAAKVYWWDEVLVQGYFDGKAEAGSAGKAKKDMVSALMPTGSRLRENKWTDFRDAVLVRSNPTEKSKRKFLFCIK